MGLPEGPDLLRNGLPEFACIPEWQCSFSVGNLDYSTLQKWRQPAETEFSDWLVKRAGWPLFLTIYRAEGALQGLACLSGRHAKSRLECWVITLRMSRIAEKEMTQLALATGSYQTACPSTLRRILAGGQMCVSGRNSKVTKVFASNSFHPPLLWHRR